MAQKRSDFYKTLNESRETKQPQNSFSSNDNELSVFNYEQISPQSSIDWNGDMQVEEETKTNRNWWQRLWDTAQDIDNNIYEGVLNFIDGIFDAGIQVVGMFSGNEQFQEGVKDVLNYDWQQHVMNVRQQTNWTNRIMSGDIFGGEYWQDWADTFTPKGSRDNLNKTKRGSYQSDLGGFGDFMTQAEQGIGYVLPSIIAAVATGGASTGVQAAVGAGTMAATGVSAYGSGATEALNDGANFYQAVGSGLVSAGIEMGTEALSFGLGKIGKLLGKTTSFGTRIGAGSFGKQLGKLTFKEIGQAALEEGTEEFLSEILSPLAKQVYKDNAVEEAWFKVGSDENINLIKNALVSFGAGAVGGVFGAGVQASALKSKLTNHGIDLANQCIEMQETHKMALKEANKGNRANQELISQYENHIGELSQDFAFQMEEFKNSNPEHYKNLMEMIKNPTDFVNALKKENTNLTKEQLNEYRTSYLENYNDIIESLNQDTYSKIAKLNSTKNSQIKIGKESDFDTKNFTKTFLKENAITEGTIIKAYYEPESKTTLINPAFKTQFYELMAHESISHGVLDTNEKVRKQLIDNIEKNDKLRELYHKNDKLLEELYGEQGIDVIESERLASFLENFVKDQKTYNRALHINQGNKLLNVLNKIKNVLNPSTDNKFLALLEKAIANVEKSVEPNTNTYKPRLAFSKAKEDTKATGVEVHADIIKNASQGLQDRFINLNSVEDVVQTMIDSTKSMLSLKEIELSTNKNALSRKTFVNFNELLNKPSTLRTNLENVVDEFLDSNISYSIEYSLGEGTNNLPLDKIEKTTLRHVLELYEEDVNIFKRESVLELEKALKEKSKKTKSLLLKEFYRGRMQDLVDKVNHYKKISGDIIKAKIYFDKGKQFLNDNRARATKVGDSYIAKLEFYKKIFSGEFRFSKTTKNVSPATITRIVKALDTYTEANIKALGGVWTTDEDIGGRAISNEAIQESALYLKSKFVDDKFPNRAITLEEMDHLRKILYGIHSEMRELTTKEGIARHQTTFKADLELRIIDNREKVKKLNLIEKELNYNSSMDSVLSNFFGSDSTIHNILYDDVFTALDNKYLQEMRMRNELRETLTKYNMWDKATSSPKTLFNKKLEFNGKKITKGILMDIYAQTLTAKGIATLQKGGYTYIIDKNHVKQHLVFTLDMLNELDTLLTDNERAFVEELVFNQYNGSWKNYKSDRDVAIRSFTDVLEDEIYYPTNKNDTKGASLDQGNFQNLDLSDQSFNKRRVNNTEHLSLLGMDIIQRARCYIDGLTKYGEMTQTLKMFDSLLKQWTTDKNGNSMSRDSLFSKNIPNWQEYKNYLIGQITGTNKGVGQGKLFGGLVAATLFGNPSVVLKQTASIPTIMLEVSPIAWLKGITKGWTNITKYKQTKQFIETQSGIAAQRWADFDSVASNLLTKEIGKISKFFGIPMEKMDESVIVIFGWTSAQEQAKIMTGAEIGTQRNNEEAVKILNKIIANTQSNSININMSMARSGNAGYIRKVLSYFSSDLQNKISRLNNLLNEGKYAKERLISLETFESEARKELDIAKLDVEKFRVEGKELENFTEELESLESIVNAKQDAFDVIKDIKNNEMKLVSGGGRSKEALKYAFAVLLSALMVASIDELIQRIYGRKGWNENTLSDFGRNLLIESTINNLPYASNIVNAIEYNQDVGGYDFSIINSAIDVVKSVKTMVEKGKFDMGVMFDLATTLGQLSGIPFKNLYNLISGVWKNIDGSGYRIDALLRGYSDAYIKKAYKEQLDLGQMKQADAYLELLMSTYKVGNNDVEVNNELNRLSRLGFSVLPKNVLTSYEDENGNEIELTSYQKNTFVSYYGLATEDVKKAIMSDFYKSLDAEYKAKIIKKLYDTYFDYAKAKTLRATSTNKNVRLLLATNGKIKLGRFISVVSKLNNVQETKNETRKELVLKEINKLRGYSKKEKLLIIWLCGYSLSKENKVVLGNYLIRNGGSKKEVKELLK